MTWTDIDPYDVAQLIDDDAMAALKGNIEYEHVPNIATYHHPGTGANYTVSGAIGQDVDPVNFSLTLVTTGKHVMACFYGQVGIGAFPNSTRLSIIRHETVSYRGRNAFYDYDVDVQNDNAGGQHVGFIKIFKDIPAGTHTFKLVWGASSGTGTMYISYRPRMTVREI